MKLGFEFVFCPSPQENSSGSSPKFNDKFRVYCLDDL